MQLGFSFNKAEYAARMTGADVEFAAQLLIGEGVFLHEYDPQKVVVFPFLGASGACVGRMLRNVGQRYDFLLYKWT
jgi:hypothetical protein